jgi:hypothetical protein
MIYFIQDTITRAIKIGYSTNPQKRLMHLQNSNQNRLVLLYAMHGELEHEGELLQRFYTFKMEGEWFRGEIAGAVSQIIAADKLNPRQPCLTVLVAGEVDYNGQSLVSQALSEIHSATPIFCVVVSGERTLDRAAWAWANQNKVKVSYYLPNWRRHGRGGGAAAARKMLKAQFDQKQLLVFLEEKVSTSMIALIKGAEKKGIPVNRKSVPSRNTAALVHQQLGTTNLSNPANATVPTP